MKYMRRLILVPMLLVGWQTFGQTTEKPMHEIHAQMIYNFLKYIQWPDDADGGEFLLGVIGEDDVYKTLKNYYEGKPKGSKKYKIKKLSSADEAASCAVIYIGKSKSGQFETIKSLVAGKPVLTITDSFNLGKKGSCINFKVVDGKLKFAMNQASINASTLKVSSQLSSMAILL
ncbi:MAG: YfiR family protein [Flammeovirgaceae bacterium]